MKNESKNPGKDNLNQLNQDKNITNKPRKEQVTNQPRKEESGEQDTNFDPTKTPEQNNGKNDPGSKKEKTNPEQPITAEYDQVEDERIESQEEEERRISEKDPVTKRNNPRP